MKEKLLAFKDQEIQTKEELLFSLRELYSEYHKDCSILQSKVMSGILAVLTYLISLNIAF